MRVWLRKSVQLHHHRDVRRKIRVLDEARSSGNVSHTCRKHGVSRDTFYRWEKQLARGGLKALINSKLCPQNPKLRVSKEIEDKVVYILADRRAAPSEEASCKHGAGHTFFAAPRA